MIILCVSLLKLYFDNYDIVEHFNLHITLVLNEQINKFVLIKQNNDY